jgi:glutathione-regulated potassium-efflux system ancillary protein KefF
MIDLVYAHPYPHRSRANHLMLAAVRDLPGLEIRSLYDLYPDFSIDVDAEQEALLRARIVVWQHPTYWYSVPPLLKLWFDKVLAYGWAYGEGEQALAGKLCQWVTTTGGDVASFSPQGAHGHPFEEFVPPLQQTARFCGMEWEPPLIVHGSHRISETELDEAALSFRKRLESLLARANGDDGHG